MKDIVAFVGASIAIVAVFIAIVVAIWLVYAIACYKVMKGMGYSNAWLAFIPYLGTCALCACTTSGEKDVELNLLHMRIPTLLFNLNCFVLLAAKWILTKADLGIIGTVLGIAWAFIFTGTALKRICAVYGEDDMSDGLYGLFGWIQICMVVKFYMLASHNK